jgi:hypothetical protein
MPFERAVTQLNLGMALISASAQGTANRLNEDMLLRKRRWRFPLSSVQMANGQVDHLKLALSQYDAQSR